MTRVLERLATEATPGPAVAAPIGSTTLLAADYDRPLFPTGTLTLTLPSAYIGWKTGTIRNSNTLTGLITVAVPAGATLDGVTNGTLVILPFQRARFVQTGATAYMTDWVDRTPIVSKAAVGSAVAAVDLAMPLGYATFEFFIDGVKIDTNSAFGIRFSYDGGATFKSGASDYYITVLVGVNSSNTPQFNYASNTYGEIHSSVGANSQFPFICQGIVYPGSATQAANALSRGLAVGGDTYTRSVVYTTHQNTAYGTANSIRFLAISGNITLGYITIRGIPQ